ncbi:response regulator [Cohnella sp.]|uniref:response regulator n=1 Tax=Cohnella sp. TaxID=1883426 RepID=UPI0035689C8D
MKALIVDDEQHVRKSIRLLADWQALGIDTVLEADNGSSALTLIQEQNPEVIITDVMMPLLNGFELMERMQAQNSRKHKFIVVSGYNDFEFIQHAMRSGGIDYLLKPVDRQQLQNALGKAVEYCRTELKWEESKKLEEEMQELKLLYRDKTLSELLVKRGVPAIPETLIRALPGLVQASSGRAAIVRFNAWEPGMVPPAEADLNAHLAAWLERFNAALPDKQCGVAFKNWNHHSEIVVLTWKNLDRMDFLAEAAHRHAGAAVEAGMHIGIGSKTDFPACLYQSYEEAIHALSRRNMLTAERRIHLYSESAADVSGRLRFDPFEENILTALKSSNKEQVRIAVRKWTEYLQGLKGIGLLHLRRWLDEYKMVKERWLDSFYNDDSGAGHRSAPTALQIPLNASGNIDLSSLEDALGEDLIRLQHAFIQSRQSRQLNIMKDIALFLQANYWKDIPLQEISDRFYLNKEHISRRFKQEFSETITDYTNRIRIEKAKVLLLNPSLRISEIALMIGYRDEKYFSRVFKKIEKMPPNLYRSKISGLSS